MNAEFIFKVAKYGFIFTWIASAIYMIVSALIGSYYHIGMFVAILIYSAYMIAYVDRRLDQT